MSVANNTDVTINNSSSNISVINIKVDNLRTMGYNSLEAWLAANPKHVYIGRNMTCYVKGAEKSKWHNPFHAKKLCLDTCLQLYYTHICSKPELLNSLRELEGCVLGCWCKPNACHGDVLVYLYNQLKQSNQLQQQVQQIQPQTQTPVTTMQTD
jgi:hypothetical protein